MLPVRIFKGMDRPDIEPIIEKLRRNRANYSCSCGTQLQDEDSTRTHWLSGHYDKAVYDYVGITPKISRAWSMPSIWTFKVKPVMDLLIRYGVGANWVDPFAGEYSSAEIRNDIEGRGNEFSLDALEFLCTLPSDRYCGVLFDPPYSTEQCLRRYTPKQNGTAGRAEYWARCKDQIARIIKPEGLCISFCWDSVGMGANRGFDIEEIMLVCHGACHNDTIVTVDRKIGNES